MLNVSYGGVSLGQVPGPEDAAAVPLFDLGLVGPVDARGTLTLPCGCDVGRDGTIAYALMTCSENHFSAYCDRKLGVEHTRTHKRRRKGCKFCAGAPLP